MTVTTTREFTGVLYKIPAEANTAYTLNFSASGSRLYAQFYAYDKDGRTLGASESTSNPGGVPITYTTPANTAYVYVAMEARLSNPTITFSNIQFEKGSTATAYEPYCGGTASPNPDYPQKVQTVTGECSVKVSGANGQSQSFPLSLGSLELCKIGDYEDSIFEKDGKWYKKANVGKAVLDGTEDWRKSGSVANNNFYYAKVLNDNTNKFGDADISTFCPYAGKIVPLMFTEYFTPRSFDDVVEKDTVGIVLNQGNKGSEQNYELRIGFGLSSSVNSADAVKTWLESHNLTVYYVKTPTTTEITDATLVAQLNALRKAKTYAGTTTIVSTGSLAPVVGVEVEKPEVIPNKNVIYLKLEDGVDRLRLYTLEAPVSSSPIINETDVVTSDGNLSTYYGSTKQQLTFRFGYMTADEYARLLDIRDRQYKNLKYPKVTIRNAGNLDITKMPAKLTLGSQNIIDNCGNVQDVDLTLRESKEVF